MLVLNIYSSPYNRSCLVFTAFINTFERSADDKHAKVTPHISLKLLLRLHLSFNPTQGFQSIILEFRHIAWVII